jgi:hypothetical protein
MTGIAIANGDIEQFIARWQGLEGGRERSNYALFLIELAEALGVERPAPSDSRRRDYAFERTVTFREPDGTASTGFIDLYKKGCFVLEAKQSRQTSWKSCARPTPRLQGKVGASASPPPLCGRDRVGGIPEHRGLGFPPPLTPPHKGEGNPRTAHGEVLP